ncbi:Early nodulin-like protein 1 [Acorus gramineus]|uniref:Early nodulin-like protein 1 n=1 Tax=Acorus gramineus TaxID=55184 RepID=A0AAV9AY76_ACOGR|nr:Early nodulin-like protein 1 [Acorus gramineus]
MENKRLVRLLMMVMLSICLFCSSEAYDFYVGGRDGWVQNPSENYNNWAERNRFQINDKLVFKYKKGEDSVLVVDEDDYKTCNTRKPIRRLNSGVSVVRFDRTGPFFFISGSHCSNGQKLIVVVLADRSKKSSPPSPSPSLPPSTSPPPSHHSPPPSTSPSPAEAPAPGGDEGDLSPSPSDDKSSAQTPSMGGFLKGFVGLVMALVFGGLV